MRHKEKNGVYQGVELPLLIKAGFLNIAATAICSTVTTNCEGSQKLSLNNENQAQRIALAGIWTRDLCLTKATLYQAELPRHLENKT